MKTVKVLHIIKSLGRGGAEMLLPETLRLHDKSRFDFYYIYFLPWKNQMVGALKENGGHVECFSARNNIAIILQVWKIIRFVRRNKIDLIHCHLPWAGFVGRVIFRITGVPVVYTEHNKQERYHKITFALNKLSFNWQSAAVAVSEDVAISIRENIRPSVQVNTILNGVNTERFVRSGENTVRKNLNIPDDAIVIGTVAVFRFQKRLEEWLEVLAGVVKKHPHVFGIIVGDGPLNNTIREKRKSLGLEQHVFMPGLQEEVMPWIDAMDIYMMTSVFEGLPIALLEAMSMGCPVVTTDAGGIKEVIRDGVEGCMRPVDQWRDLTECAEELVLDAGLRNTLGLQSRARVENNFSLRKMVSELEDLYKNTINGNKKGRP